MDLFDRSFEKETSSDDGWGPDWFYGFGSFPYYSQHSSLGMGASVQVLNRRSVKDFIFYPWFEIYFICSDQVMSPLVDFRDVPAQEMFHLVKDLRGGVQVMKTNNQEKSSLQKDDIIIKFQNKRIERRYLLLWDLQKTAGEVILLREGRKLEMSLHPFDLTKVVRERENDLKAELCSHKKYHLKSRKICQD